jgi:hypothetical protein
MFSSEVQSTIRLDYRLKHAAMMETDSPAD